MALFEMKSGGVTGTLNIKANGTYDVKKYASVNVQVPAPTYKKSSQQKSYSLGQSRDVSQTYTFSDLTQVLGITGFTVTGGSLGAVAPKISISGNSLTMTLNSSSGATYNINVTLEVQGV